MAESLHLCGMVCTCYVSVSCIPASRGLAGEQVPEWCLFLLKLLPLTWKEKSSCQVNFETKETNTVLTHTNVDRIGYLAY